MKTVPIIFVSDERAIDAISNGKTVEASYSILNEEWKMRQCTNVHGCICTFRRCRSIYSIEIGMVVRRIEAKKAHNNIRQYFRHEFPLACSILFYSDRHSGCTKLPNTISVQSFSNFAQNDRTLNRMGLLSQ